MRYKHLDIVFLEDGMFTVKNNSTKNYVKLGSRETDYLLRCLGYDGNEFKLSETVLLDPDEQSFMNHKFDEWGFLDENKVIVKDKKKFDFTRIKVCEVNPQNALAKVPRFVKDIFSLRGVFLLIIMTIAANVVMFSHKEELVRAVQDSFHLSIMQYIAFYFMMIITIMLHECGHAICCSRHGGKISSMGLMLFFMVPCFFCDVSDIYMFKDKKKSLGVAISGIAMNYALGTLACLAYFYLYHIGIYVPLLIFYYLANIGFVVYNLFPFVKLDGYWVITALLGVDNLLDKSIITFLTAILNTRDLKRLNCKMGKKLVLFFYGLIAIVSRPIFWIVGVYSVCKFLDARDYDYLNGILVGFVAIMVLKDLSDLLRKYIDMYRNQRQRVLGLI
ncbi:MAG: hypothetical protein K6F75_08995 [Butyrivibrio sp.]|nr:hypothetical protein [Butyrivibrio sp.]